MATKCAIILLIVVALNASICCNAINALGSGEILNSGDFLQYDNHVLAMQKNCNLVLYDSGHLIWASGTDGFSSDCHCRLEYDGRLVIFSSSQIPIWISTTVGSTGNYVLVLRKGPSLVIYGNSIWNLGNTTNAANSDPMFMPKIINANQTDSIIKKVTSTV